MSLTQMRPSDGPMFGRVEGRSIQTGMFVSGVDWREATAPILSLSLRSLSQGRNAVRQKSGLDYCARS